ncbi:MAG: hypothetical protein J6D47_21625 [Peptostreptococcaceae bacterium]|jgi:DNA polymerase III delta prime subunit|nr:hypothetical protein [Peptostreptococcaceae bacterium]
MLVLRKDWINLVQSQLNSLDSSEILVFKTLKEDRSVYINKIGNYYKVIEDGFNNMTYDNLSLKQLIVLLKKLDTLEFTQSNKLLVSIQKFTST